jgi:phospholipid/cholesterol/gamma-HCH transport system permease protein
MTPALGPMRAIGRAALAMVAGIGRFGLFVGPAVAATVTPPFFARQLGRQLVEIGFYSLPVVGLTMLFTGMVLALQSYTGFARFNAESAIANVVVLSITRELGPVLAGLMVAGRIGASMAAELGTMRVTEQIDALTTLSTSPFRYLIAPRVLAAVLVMPPLVLIADVIGVMGGWIIGVTKLGFSSGAYLQSTIEFVRFADVGSGLVKAAVFGALIALISCWCGFASKGGARGVGQATTNAVVGSSIMILLADYVLTELFFIK